MTTQPFALPDFELGADPWAALSDAERWAAARADDELPVLELPALPKTADVAAVCAATDAALGDLDDDGACALVADDVGLEQFALSPACAARLVALRLPSNRVKTLALPAATWLRSLSLSSNNLVVPPPTRGLGRLLWLDLSANEGIDCSGVDWAALPSLRGLDLSACALTSLESLPTTVETLLLAENELEELDALKPLSRLGALTEVDLSGNPFADERGYAEAVRAVVPALRRLDGNGVASGSGGGGAQAWDAVESAAARRDRMARLDESIKSEEAKAEGCSCIFGNACTDRYSCLVWEKREEVALAVRSGKTTPQQLSPLTASNALLKKELRAIGINLE